MQDKYLIEVEGQWNPMTLEQMLEESMLGVDLKTNRRRRWTGLKDKNGVDIFEGDLLVSKQFCTPEPGELKYLAPTYVVVEKNGRPRTINDGSRWEVIGNIYENPELLGKIGEDGE